MNINEFLKNLAIAVEENVSNADTPSCPKCTGTMKFHDGNRKHGEEYWQCPHCGYNVTENEVSLYINKYRNS